MTRVHECRLVPERLIAGLAVAAALLLGACDRSPLDTDRRKPDKPLAGLVVSEPRAAAPGGAGTAALVAGGTNRNEARAFVSMAPGTLPEAVSVRIRNVTTDDTPTDPILVYDGGFDPVAIFAKAGDQLELAVLDIGGATTHMTATVPVRRPPVVVRTNPPRGRTDVALSLVIEVVFSEPIDARTLDGAVQLLRNGSVVSGTVQLLPVTAFVAQYEPDSQLASETDYELVVTTAVRDLDGDALAEGVRIAFRTESSGGTFSVAQISAGTAHTCAITTRGTAYCWGAAVALGTGGAGSNTGTPQAVAGGLVFAQVSAGGTRTCGVAADGIAYCWGTNTEGHLGDGTTQDRATPTPVAGGLRFTQVSPSSLAVSGPSSAISTDGVAFCWPSFECGSGGETDKLEPVPVDGELRFTQVSTGMHHSCGITTDRVAYCWGNNPWGQFGDGTESLGNSRGPTPVAGGLRFKQISAGGLHTCAVATDDVAYCWGDNGFGELGDGTTMRRLTPTPVAGGLRFAQVSAGGLHTCGVTTDNVAYCWGQNGGFEPGTPQDGRLGDGTTIRRLTPVPVAGGLRFAQVSAGGSHTCGVTTDKVAYCWGSNHLGQLGYGTPSPSGDPFVSLRRTPTRVITP
jgi:alpha-tubulin suppressor-like RCC1 family protein